MASTTAESTSKSVHEIAVNGQDPPEKYFFKGSDLDLDAPVPLVNVAVIDLRLLTCPSTRPPELDKLRSALTSWGCFQVINHGMTDKFLDQVREVARNFFGLTEEEKKKYLRESDSIEGYGNDMVLSEFQTLDWTDRLYLTFTPQHQRRLKFWPQTPPDFRETLQEYFVKSQEINETVLKAMASSLNLEETCFLEQYGEAEAALMSARFNYYPPCRRPNRVLGVKPHADASAITILLQDKHVEGLQFLKDNEWFKVPIIPHALLINAGDQIEMEIISLSIVVEENLTRLNSLIINQTILASNHRVELRRLQNLLTEIRDRLRTESISFWLMELQEVVHKAEDLIDELAYEILRPKVTPLKFLKKLVFNVRLASKVRILIGSLNKIKNEANALRFEGGRIGPHIDLDRETDSVLEIPVIGREDDISKIINLLTRFSGQRVLTVVPIVGMDGLGKTSLAKLVCRRVMALKLFRVNKWV